MKFSETVTRTWIERSPNPELHAECLASGIGVFTNWGIGKTTIRRKVNVNGKGN